MTSICSLAIELFFPKSLEAEIVYQVIKPEIGSKHEKRSKVLMNINKNVLSLQINAEDLTALKASANSYLKLINLSHKIIIREALNGR